MNPVAMPPVTCTLAADAPATPKRKKQNNIDVYMHTGVRKHVYVCIYVSGIYVDTYVYVCMYIYICIHIHVSMWLIYRS